MKILAISDRPPRQPIKTILENNQIDLICTLGDLDQFSIQELAEVTEIPKLGVYGNHDSGRYFEELGIKNMHLHTFEYRGLSFGGFEGCVRYKEDPYAKMYTQEEAQALLQNFPYVDIMLAHSPPYGINDEPESLAHQGYKALRRYLEERKPAHLFHGHTYPSEENLITEFGDTKIIYVFADRIIDIRQSP